MKQSPFQAFNWKSFDGQTFQRNWVSFSRFPWIVSERFFSSHFWICFLPSVFFFKRWRKISIFFIFYHIVTIGTYFRYTHIHIKTMLRGIAHQMARTIFGRSTLSHWLILVYAICLYHWKAKAKKKKHWTQNNKDHFWCGQSPVCQTNVVRADRLK